MARTRRTGRTGRTGRMTLEDSLVVPLAERPEPGTARARVELIGREYRKTQKYADSIVVPDKAFTPSNKARFEETVMSIVEKDKFNPPFSEIDLYGQTQRGLVDKINEASDAVSLAPENKKTEARNWFQRSIGPVLAKLIDVMPDPVVEGAVGLARTMAPAAIWAAETKVGKAAIKTFEYTGEVAASSVLGTIQGLIPNEQEYERHKREALERRGIPEIQFFSREGLHRFFTEGPNILEHYSAQREAWQKTQNLPWGTKFAMEMAFDPLNWVPMGWMFKAGKYGLTGGTRMARGGKFIKPKPKPKLKLDYGAVAAREATSSAGAMQARMEREAEEVRKIFEDKSLSELTNEVHEVALMHDQAVMQGEIVKANKLLGEMGALQEIMWARKKSGDMFSAEDRKAFHLYTPAANGIDRYVKNVDGSTDYADEIELAVRKDPTLEIDRVAMDNPGAAESSAMRYTKYDGELGRRAATIAGGLWEKGIDTASVTKTDIADGGELIRVRLAVPLNRYNEDIVSRYFKVIHTADDVARIGGRELFETVIEFAIGRKAPSKAQAKRGVAGSYEWQPFNQMLDELLKQGPTVKTPFYGAADFDEIVRRRKFFEQYGEVGDRTLSESELAKFGGAQIPDVNQVKWARNRDNGVLERSYTDRNGIYHPGLDDRYGNVAEQAPKGGLGWSADSKGKLTKWNAKRQAALEPLYDMLVATGLREGELALLWKPGTVGSLTTPDSLVDIYGRTPRLKLFDPKNGNEWWHVLTERGRTVLLDYVEGFADPVTGVRDSTTSVRNTLLGYRTGIAKDTEPLAIFLTENGNAFASRDALNRTLTEAVKRGSTNAGFTFTGSMIRHFYATELMSGGGSMSEIGVMLGHTSTENVPHYANAAQLLRLGENLDLSINSMFRDVDEWSKGLKQVTMQMGDESRFVFPMADRTINTAGHTASRPPGREVPWGRLEEGRVRQTITEPAGIHLEVQRLRMSLESAREAVLNVTGRKGVSLNQQIHYPRTQKNVPKGNRAQMIDYQNIAEGDILFFRYGAMGFRASRRGLEYMETTGKDWSDEVKDVYERYGEILEALRASQAYIGRHEKLLAARPRAVRRKRGQAGDPEAEQAQKEYAKERTRQLNQTLLHGRNLWVSARQRAGLTRDWWNERLKKLADDQIDFGVLPDAVQNMVLDVQNAASQLDTYWRVQAQQISRAAAAGARAKAAVQGFQNLSVTDLYTHLDAFTEGRWGHLIFKIGAKNPDWLVTAAIRGTRPENKGQLIGLKIRRVTGTTGGQVHLARGTPETDTLIERLGPTGKFMEGRNFQTLWANNGIINNDGVKMVTGEADWVGWKTFGELKKTDIVFPTTEGRLWNAERVANLIRLSSVHWGDFHVNKKAGGHAYVGAAASLRAMGIGISSTGKEQKNIVQALLDQNLLERVDKDGILTPDKKGPGGFLRFTRAVIDQYDKQSGMPLDAAGSPIGPKPEPGKAGFADDFDSYTAADEGIERVGVSAEDGGRGNGGRGGRGGNGDDFVPPDSPGGANDDGRLPRNWDPLEGRPVGDTPLANEAEYLRILRPLDDLTSDYQSRGIHKIIRPWTNRTARIPIEWVLGKNTGASFASKIIGAHEFAKSQAEYFANQVSMVFGDSQKILGYSRRHGRMMKMELTGVDHPAANNIDRAQTAFEIVEETSGPMPGFDIKRWKKRFRIPELRKYRGMSGKEWETRRIDTWLNTPRENLSIYYNMTPAQRKLYDHYHLFIAKLQRTMIDMGYDLADATDGDFMKDYGKYVARAIDPDHPFNRNRMMRTLAQWGAKPTNFRKRDYPYMRDGEVGPNSERYIQDSFQSLHQLIVDAYGYVADKQAFELLKPHGLDLSNLNNRVIAGRMLMSAMHRSQEDIDAGVAGSSLATKWRLAASGHYSAELLAAVLDPDAAVRRGAELPNGKYENIERVRELMIGHQKTLQTEKRVGDPWIEPKLGRALGSIIIGDDELGRLAYEPDVIKEIKDYVDGMTALSGPAIRIFGSFSSTIRTLAATFDTGAPFIHGFPALTLIPLQAAQMNVKQAKTLPGKIVATALSPAKWGKTPWAIATKNMYAELLWSPGTRSRYWATNIEWMNAAKAHHVQFFGHELSQIVGGSVFNTVRDVPIAGEVMGRFGESFNTFVDIARLELWKGLSPLAKTERELNELGNAINKIVGTMDASTAGLRQPQRTVESAFLFFAAMLRRATVALVWKGMEGAGLTVAKGTQAGYRAVRGVPMDPETLIQVGIERRQMMATLGSMMGAAGAMGALVYFSGNNKDVFKPDNADFMSAKFGNVRIGIGTPYYALARMGISLMRQLVSDPAGTGTFVLDDLQLLKWGRSAMAPAPATLVDLVVGKGYVGDHLRGTDGSWERLEIGKYIGRQGFPFYVESMVWDFQGMEKTTTLADFVGLRTSPIGIRERRDSAINLYLATDLSDPMLNKERARNDANGIATTKDNVNQVILFNLSKRHEDVQAYDEEIRASRFLRGENDQQRLQKYIDGLERERVKQRTALDGISLKFTSGQMSGRDFRRESSLIRASFRGANDAMTKEYGDVITRLDERREGRLEMNEGYLGDIAYDAFRYEVTGSELLEDEFGNFKPDVYRRLEMEFKSRLPLGSWAYIEQRREMKKDEPQAIIDLRAAQQLLMPYWELYNSLWGPNDWRTDLVQGWFDLTDIRARDAYKLMYENINGTSITELLSDLGKARKLYRKQHPDIDHALVRFYDARPIWEQEKPPEYLTPGQKTRFRQRRAQAAVLRTSFRPGTFPQGGVWR